MTREESRQYPMTGVEIIKNPNNGFVIFELHYSADPSKRSPEWKEEVRKGMPRRKFLQEYEKSWESFSGLPVFDDWDKEAHGIKGPIEPLVGLPLLRGWDFGLTPACVVVQLQEDCLCVLKEFTAVNMGAERFSTLVLKECAVLYPSWADQRRDWHDYIDPSGNFRKDTDEGTCAKILDGKGLRTIPGAITWEERRTSVETFLTRRTKKGVCFKVSIPGCPMIVRGFDGGYRYNESAVEIEANNLRPIKNEFSHPHDALQMITSRILMMRNKFRIKIPTPSYTFNQDLREMRSR